MWIEFLSFLIELELELTVPDVIKNELYTNFGFKIYELQIFMRNLINFHLKKIKKFENQIHQLQGVIKKYQDWIFF